LSYVGTTDYSSIKFAVCAPWVFQNDIV
jgi:hypothetical protein